MNIEPTADHAYWTNTSYAKVAADFPGRMARYAVIGARNDCSTHFRTSSSRSMSLPCTRAIVFSSLMYKVTLGAVTWGFQDNAVRECDVQWRVFSPPSTSAIFGLSIGNPPSNIRNMICMVLHHESKTGSTGYMSVIMENEERALHCLRLRLHHLSNDRGAYRRIQPSQPNVQVT